MSRRPLLRFAAVVAATALVTTLLGACGNDGAACTAAVRERLDPNSEQHVLPGAPTPSYATNPPTSGAHQVGDWPTGVLHDAIRQPVQVAMLEGGEVLVQYRARDIDAGKRRDLEALATRLEHVTVAPNPDLPTPVVATAWTYKQTCRAVDTDALTRFARQHAGKGA